MITKFKRKNLWICKQDHQIHLLVSTCNDHQQRYERKAVEKIEKETENRDKERVFVGGEGD